MRLRTTKLSSPSSGLDVDHVEVDPLPEGALGVVDVGDPARHAGGEVAPGRAEHDDPAPGHVLAAVVAHALDHGHGARVAHAEALPHLAPDEGLAARGPVEDHVAGDDLLLGREDRLDLGPHDEAPAGQALAEVVVGVAVEAHGHAARHEGPEALPGRAGEGQRDGVVGQPGRPEAPADLRAQQGPDGAVDVGDGQGHRDGRAIRQRGGTRLDELMIEGLLQAVVLQLGLVARHVVGHVGHGQHRAQVEPGRLPVGDRHVRVEQVDPADRLLQRAQAQGGQQLAHLLGDVLEERLDELGLAAELGPQGGGLGGDADGTRIEVADPHHDAARDHQRRRGEAELLGARAARR